MPATDTEMQRAFAAEYAANGGNGTKAAREAGYAEKYAHESARRLLQNPTVLEHIRKHFIRLQARSGAIGLHALASICEDTKSPAAARVSAARALCEHASLIGPGKEAGKGDEDNTPSIGLSAKDVITEFRKLRGAGSAA